MALITLKAVTTVTDQGVFEAVISTQGVDREKDVVDADGMVKALRKWPRQIPLTWEHSTRPDEIFGDVDPQSVRNVNGEVVVGGRVDMDSKNGADAWRSFKARRVGFSFGYLTLAAVGTKGHGRHITELDVYEITATRAPMNNETRVLSTKAVDERIERCADLDRKIADLTEQREALAATVEADQVETETDLPETPAPAEATDPVNPEQNDNPEPNTPPGVEEALARTRRLLLETARPLHLTGFPEPQETDAS